MFAHPWFRFRPFVWFDKFHPAPCRWTTVCVCQRYYQIGWTVWSWIEPASTTRPHVCVWVCWTEALASPSPFSKAFSFILSSGKAFGYVDEMAGAGFYFQIFFTEAHFFYFSKIIRSLFSIAWLMPSKRTAGGSEKRKIPLFSPSILPSLWPFFGVLLCCQDTKRLRWIPKWHSFQCSDDDLWSSNL